MNNISLRQATNILAKAAERAEYKHIGFTRSPIEVSIQFHEAFLDDKPEVNYSGAKPPELVKTSLS